MILNKPDYDQKIKALLSDQKTYKRLPKDPTPAFERRMNKLLLDLQKSGALTSPLYNHLRSSAGKIPLLYGLPKIHKPEVPLRPIVSFVGSPSYQLSKHLAHILSPLVGNTPSHVKNSTQFAEFISQQSVAPGEIYTSLPKLRSQNLCNKSLDQDKSSVLLTRLLHNENT